MGWTNSVGFIQIPIRKIVFEICGVPRTSEACRENRIYAGSAAVACIDGFDCFTHLKEVDGELRTIDVNLDGEKEVAKFLMCRSMKKKRS